jgi:hypothetical protein
MSEMLASSALNILHEWVHLESLRKRFVLREIGTLFGGRDYAIAAQRIRRVENWPSESKGAAKVA